MEIGIRTEGYKKTYLNELKSLVPDGKVSLFSEKGKKRDLGKPQGDMLETPYKIKAVWGFSKER